MARISLLLLCFLPQALAQSGLELKRLKTELFKTKGYNTKVRPVENQTSVINVFVDFALVGINALSDADQALTTTGFLTVDWIDELLDWAPTDYDNITTMLVPQNEVWKPDITLDNGADSKVALGQPFIMVTVHYTGKVTWSPYEVFQTDCGIDIVHFPFDQQKCDINFITYTHDDTQVKLNFGSSGFYQYNFEKNGKWDVTAMTTSAAFVDLKTVLSFSLHLKRKFSFYMIFLILPSILLSILNVFVFALPAGSGEKIGYTISVFLSYALFYTILSQTLPKNSEVVSTIAAYLFFMMFLSTLATIVTALQLRIYNRNLQGRLPYNAVKFIKIVLYERCFCRRKNKVLAKKHLDGNWTKVIGPWLNSDWKDFVDALDFVLFWLFMFITVLSTVVALVMASSGVALS